MAELSDEAQDVKLQTLIESLFEAGRDDCAVEIQGS